MYRLLDLATPEQAGGVRQFLAQLPEIRTRRLAFNLGVTLADAFAVATPLLAPDGTRIARSARPSTCPQRSVSTISAKSSRRPSPVKSC